MKSNYNRPATMWLDPFYQNLTTFSDFSQAFDFRVYQSVPDDWWVIVADIIDSTAAIKAGHYKSVNFVGSLPIIAAINALAPLEFPYVFGGDGATLLVPETHKQQILEILIATAQTAVLRYDLHYRVGAVNVKTLRQHHKDLRIAKFCVSAHYQQAFFIGGGLSLAETLVKNDPAFQVDITQNVNAKPNFSGLECRWQDILSPREQVASLLIKMTDIPDNDYQSAYTTLLKHLENIAGNQTERSVVTPQNLILSLSPEQLIYEAKLNSPLTQTTKRLVRMLIENIIGACLMAFSVNQWGDYKNNMIRTTDAEKFDDTLRMVIALTRVQTEQLTKYLEQAYQAGQLVYGIHISNRALMTCLIFDRHGRQVHFIDAADGGYTLAARDFKQRDVAYKKKCLIKS